MRLKIRIRCRPTRIVLLRAALRARPLWGIFNDGARRNSCCGAAYGISLTGLFGTASGQFSSLFTGPARVWSYAGAATLPVFTAGSISGQVKQAEALQQQALFQYQKAIQVAFQEVAAALVSLQKTLEQLAVQGREVDALATYSTLARLRYEGGYTSYIEVLDAERSLFNAQLSYAQTQGAVLTSSVDLYKAMGGSWVTDAERMTPVSYGANGAVENFASAPQSSP